MNLISETVSWRIIRKEQGRSNPLVRPSCRCAGQTSLVLHYRIPLTGKVLVVNKTVISVGAKRRHLSQRPITCWSGFGEAILCI